jgi:hypothetical protein
MAHDRIELPGAGGGSVSGGYVTGRLREVCGNASPCVPVCGVCRANGRVKLWDAVNAVVVASGESDSSTGVARQKAVVLVESEVDALVDAARATAHAAAYAEAVADVRMLLRACGLAAQARLANPNERPVLEYTSKISGELVGRLDSGAHVGAAKKGGG